jgi:hypothetical protein
LIIQTDGKVKDFVSIFDIREIFRWQLAVGSWRIVSKLSGTLIPHISLFDDCQQLTANRQLKENGEQPLTATLHFYETIQKNY